MRKLNKVLLITSLSMMGVGLILGTVGFLSGGTPNLSLGTSGFIVNKGDSSSQNVSEELPSFNRIKADIGSLDFEIVESDHYGIEIQNSSNSKVEYQVESDQLTIKQKVKWNVGINLSFGDGGSDIKVYVPKKANLDSIQVNLASGDLQIKNINLNNLDIDCASGGIYLENMMVSKNLKLDLASGDLRAKNVKSNRTEVSVASGDLQLNGEFRGLTKIDCASGDVQVATTLSQTDYNLNLTSLSGDITVGDIEVSKDYISNTNQANDMKISSFSGDMHIRFNK